MGFFSTAEKITIKIRLYSGIDREIGLTDYNPHDGIDLTLPGKSNLKAALKLIGCKKKSYYAVFCNGDRVGVRYKLVAGDQISLIVPSAGG
jgi:hypothetical protein